ncbi:MAG: family 43 glycosylhydrolase [Acidimicrobiales bacterium]
MQRAATAPVPELPARLDLDQRLQSLLRQTAGDLDVSSGQAERSIVRRRFAQLYRRRKLRYRLGSSTLAAGMFAGGGLQLREQVRPGAVPHSEAAVAPAPAAPTEVPSPAAPPATSSWTWDPQEGEGTDRVAADPGAYFAGGRFHVYTTSATHCVAGTCAGHWVPRFTSSDLHQPGRLDGDAMPSRPDWVAADDRAIWAPAVALIDDRHVLFFAATSGRPQDGKMKCLGAAVSPVPEGPFVPLPDPLRCVPGYWAIDPYPVLDGDNWYLLWREDDQTHSTGTIVAAPLAAGGLALAGGEPSTLLVGQSGWEEGHPHDNGIGPIENPAMARHPVTGELLLTWSAHRWETQDYATGLARCEGPLGPCRRLSDEEPWLRTSADPGVTTEATFGGAGGLSFVVGPDGHLYAVLHAYAGSGQAPDDPRVGWAFRVEVDTAAGPGYRLTNVVGNHSAETAVSAA